MTEKLAVELVSDMLARRECDVVQHLRFDAHRMIAQILGIPECDVDDFRRWSRTPCVSWTSRQHLVAWQNRKSMSAMACVATLFLQQFSTGD